jgi:phosphoribosylformimino-5-aminoimidazole carboxamide ribonucleotide (ProFAR) isomerase
MIESMEARQRTAVAINTEITLLYWQIGHRINTEILQGQRAEYGKQIVVSLSKQLTQAYGKGWSERQLYYCLLKSSPIERFCIQCVQN